MYPVYKLLRAVNRQYPNNGFINYVDVTEDIYDTDDPDTNRVIDEDLRDLINETLQEIYLDIAVDEVYSFPTVAGQNQYELPLDCDLRDIQEVTRTYAFRPLRPPCPVPPPPGGKVTITYYPGEEGTGKMLPDEVDFGASFTVPFCFFTPPEGKIFDTWINGAGYPVAVGSTIEVTHDDILTATWKINQNPEPVWEAEVKFTITDAAMGNMGTLPGGGFITEQSKTADVGETVGDVFQENEIEVTANEGYQFDGWSLDGETVVATETIMATTVPQEGLDYIAVFSNTNVDPEPVWDEDNPDPDPQYDDPEEPDPQYDDVILP